MTIEILLEYSKREDIGNRQGLKWLEQMATSAYNNMRDSEQTFTINDERFFQLGVFIDVLQDILRYGAVAIKDEPTDSSPSTNYPRSWDR